MTSTSGRDECEHVSGQQATEVRGLLLETCGSMIWLSVRFRFDSMPFPAVPVPVPVLILMLNQATTFLTRLSKKKKKKKSQENSKNISIP